MMHRLVLVGLGVLLAATSASAASFDLAGDWSTAANPNGPWTYRQDGSALTGIVNPWSGLNEPVWATPNGPLLPAWFKAVNTGSADCGSCDWLVGDVVTHTWDSSSGGANGLSNVIWTNTGGSAVLATVTGDVWDARHQFPDRLNDWALYWSGDLVNPLASGSLLDTNDRNNRQTYGPSPVLVQPGEYIELLVTKTATSPFGDFVGTNFHVETEVAALAVPEPATLLILLVSGLAAAGGLGRKRRQP